MSEQYHNPAAAATNDDPFDNYEHSNEPEYDVGVSDQTILIISVVGFGIMTLVVYVLIVSRSKSAEELDRDGENGGDAVDYEEELLKADVATLNRAQRRARAKAVMKRQRRAPVNHGLGDLHEVRGDGDNNNNQIARQIEGEGDENDEHHNSVTNLSRKERNVAAKAAERKARHSLEEVRREEQRQAVQLAKEEKKKRLQLEEQKAREEKIAREQARERQQQEDYERWNIFLQSPQDPTNKITVEEWVQELVGNEDGPNSKKSIVSLDKLASRFDVSFEVATDRIKHLIREARVTGILDEEQRFFIVLNHAQMISLASLVLQKGEVSLLDLSRATRDFLEDKGEAPSKQ